MLSIDPGHRGGDKRSYSVIQVWAVSKSDHFLVDQWRKQSTYDELRSAYWALFRRYRPGYALIETTANGPALIADVRRPSITVVEIPPDGRSKAARLREHLRTFRARRIHLPEGKPWREEFIAEFMAFPGRPFR